MTRTLAVLAALALSSLCAGCALHAQPLGDVPLKITRHVSEQQRTKKSILILPFEDDRGDTYVKLAPSVFIPVVHLFHDARDVYYPDHGLLTTYHGPFSFPTMHHWGDHRERVSLVGSVASSLPVILAHAMKAMGLSDDAMASAWSADQREYDYVLTGKVKRTHFRDDASGVLALVLGPFGVPTGAASYDLDYEVTLLDGHDRKRVLFTHAYHFHDKRTVGLYYNHNWAYRLFMAGLNETVPSVVEDVAHAMESTTPPTSAPAPVAKR